MKHVRTKKILHWLAGILVTVILLPVILTVLLYIPPIQRWAVREVAEYASQESGLQITLDEVRITPLLDLDLKDLLIRQEGNRILAVESAVVDLDFSRILELKLGVEAVELNGGDVDTRDLIAQMRMKGALENFHLSSDEIDLNRKTVILNGTQLNGCDLDIALRDTTIIDTTESAPIEWQIELDKVALNNSHVTLHMPGDSMRVEVKAREAVVEGADVDLNKKIYRLKHLMLKGDSLRYDLPYEPLAGQLGMDFNHISLKDIDVDVSNVTFRQDDNYLSANIAQCALKERSGLTINKLQTNLLMDSTSIHLKGLDLETPNSLARGNADVEWSALQPHSRGKMDVDLHAEVGYEDVMHLAGNMIPDNLRKIYPKQPLILDLNVDGNMDAARLDNTRLIMPTVIDIRTSGDIQNVMDSTLLCAQLQWDVKTMNLNPVRQYLGLNDVVIPPMTINAQTNLVNCNEITADALLQERGGRAHVQGKIDLARMAYQAKMRISNLQIHDFLPHDSIYHLTAKASVQGAGTDMLSPSTRLKAQASVQQLEYASWNLQNIDLSAKLEHGKGNVEVNSENDLIRLQACAEAFMKDRKLQASAFSLDMSHIDLYALHLSKNELSASMVMHMEGSSDFDQTHSLKARIEALELQTKDSTYYPVDLSLDAKLMPQSITATADAGDLQMNITSTEGLNSLLSKSDKLMAELTHELDSLNLQKDTLKTLLPNLNMHIQCGRKNPVNNILRFMMGYTFNKIAIDMTSNPEDGLNGNGYLHGLNTGAVLLDTISWRIKQTPERLTLDGKIKNGPKNRMVVFESNIHGELMPNGLSTSLDFIDAKGKKGVDLGMEVNVLQDGMRVHMTPLNPIIAYRKFQLNKDNFVELSRTGRIEALVDLLADDGTGLKFYSTPNEEALQDLSLNINHLNIGELSQVMPFMPELGGFLHGDIHYMQADSTTTISADLTARDFVYEGTNLGNMGVNGIYFPNNDGSHYVDGIVSQNDREIMSLQGKYWEQDKEGMIDATASLSRLPFSLANAFIPNQMAQMKGYANGEMEVTGRASNPILTGELATDSMHLLADAYNIDLRFPDDTLVINRSHIDLDRIDVYAAGDSPLTLDGAVDFSNVDNIKLNLTMNAKNYQLINAPKSRKAEAYGKVFVDMNARMWGTLNDLKMRGNLDVLGNTDVNYVLKDSPITVEDQLADLVTFCDFSDTVKVEPQMVSRQNIDIQMKVNMEQSAQVHCILSDDGNDYIDLQGGGNLEVTYDTQNDLRIFGRYTILQGTMRYSLMAIPLNDFKIQSGSYVEFTGEMMNPTLNISATERVKASVTENSVPRNVAFDVGMTISKTLEDMGLEFTVEAPEDLSVQNQLTGMSLEDRGRVAVTMLVTGMYLTEDSNLKGGFSYTNTLNTYLQSAINNIAGQALGTVDLNFGVENSTTQAGSTTTDYSFSFTKRFWGNRVSIIVGGKVSTGKDAVNTGQTIIDNVALEYRLDKTATRYVRLYYDRNYESLLEGQLTEMGAGLVLRKKTEKLGELFIFRQKKEKKEGQL